MNSDFEKLDLARQDQVMADMQSAAFQDFQTAGNAQDRNRASHAFAALALSRNAMMINLAKYRHYESARQLNERGSKTA